MIIWFSSEKAKEALFYSYQRHINGFAAVLDEEKAAEIESKKAHKYSNIINGLSCFCFSLILMSSNWLVFRTEHPDVVSVFLNQKNELHTTHSWDFMDMEDRNGFVPSDSLFKKARYGEDTIIANLDTGN